MLFRSVTASIDATIATTVLSRGRSRPDVNAAIEISGDALLGSSLRDAMAAVMSAYSDDL